MTELRGKGVGFEAFECHLYALKPIGFGNPCLGQDIMSSCRFAHCIRCNCNTYLICSVVVHLGSPFRCSVQGKLFGRVSLARSQCCTYDYGVPVVKIMFRVDLSCPRTLA